MKTYTLLLAFLVAFATLNSSYACKFEASNNANGTLGGACFQKEIGLDYSVRVLEKATYSFWNMFNQQSELDRKNFTLIALIVESMSGVATNFNGWIFVSADYIGNFSGNVKTEITGLMYHEVARVWQWDASGQAPIGLLTGIADFFRLKAGYAPARWVRSGQGLQWDEGYDVTARFLDYCNDKYPALVVFLNAWLKYGYSDVLFVDYTGKTVDELWAEYKAQYA